MVVFIHHLQPQYESQNNVFTFIDKQIGLIYKFTDSLTDRHIALFGSICICLTNLHMSCLVKRFVYVWYIPGICFYIFVILTYTCYIPGNCFIYVWHIILICLMNICYMYVCYIFGICLVYIYICLVSICHIFNIFFKLLYLRIKFIYSSMIQKFAYLQTDGYLALLVKHQTLP